VRDIDLIPAAYLKRELLRRMVRRFVLGMVLVVVVVIGARMGLNRAITTEAATVARLQKADQIYAQTESRADGFRQQRAIVETRLSQLDQLRGRDRLRLLLTAIDSAYAPAIWLDELQFSRRETPPAAAPAAPNQPPPPKPGIEHRVQLTGHATDHSRLAEFMRRLSTQPGIADVRLLDTGLRTYTNTQVIDLSLTLAIEDPPGAPK
jgi:hypothetical protein